VESQGPPSAVIATAHQLPTPSDSTVSATCQQLSTAPICVPEALSVGSGMGALAIQEAGDFDAMLASRDITPPWTLSDAEFAPVFAQLTQEFEAAQAEMNAKDDYDEPDLATLRLEATYCLYRADSRRRDVKVKLSVVLPVMYAAIRMDHEALVEQARAAMFMEQASLKKTIAQMTMNEGIVQDLKADLDRFRVAASTPSP